MKLNPKSQLGLNITEKRVRWIVANHYNKCIKNLDMERQKISVQWLLDLFSVELKKDEDVLRMIKESGAALRSLNLAPNENYLIAQTAIELAKRIKIDEDKFDVKFLSKIKDKKITFLLGRNVFIRYVKRGSVIFALRVDANETENGDLRIDYIIFMINTATGTIDYEHKPDAPFADDNFKFFVQLLVFTELSKLEIKILEPKQKFGTRKLGKYINESNQNVTIVDSVWNKMVVRTEGFGVRSHWRFQRCGKNFSEVEYIFIEEFRKDGYIRKPRKELV